MEGPFHFAFSHFAHEGPVRSLSRGLNPNEFLSGCQSNSPCLKIWKLESTSLEDYDNMIETQSDTIERIPKNLVQLYDPIYHDHWVTAVTCIPTCSERKIFPEVIFF